MPAIVFVAIPFLVALIAWGVYAAYVQAQKRKEAMLQAADDLGWPLDASSHSDWDSRYPQFSCFRQGHSRSACNLMQGQLDISGRSTRCTLGEYSYKVTHQNGKQTTTTTHYFSFAIVDAPYGPSPGIAVRPESIFDGIGAFMGFDDIDFESVDFSRRYHVTSNDKRFAYDLIDAQMMEFLLRDKPRTFELADQVLCLRSSSGLWNPSDLPGQVAWVKEFFERWPRHLRTLES